MGIIPMPTGGGKTICDSLDSVGDVEVQESIDLLERLQEVIGCKSCYRCCQIDDSNLQKRDIEQKDD